MASVDLTAARREARAARRGGRLVDVALYGLAIGFAVIAFAPFFWTVTTSLMTLNDVMSVPPRVLPVSPEWGNYTQVFVRVPFLRWIVNTVQVTVLATLGTLVSATLVAYSFARFRYPGRDLFFFVTIGTLILPAEVTVVPSYLLFRNLGWLDTYRPLVVPFWLGGGPLYIFLLRQFMLGIPRDLDEAARIDGAGPLRTLVDVLAPLLRPALTAVVIISFIAHWDDFFGPLIYLNTPISFTLSIGVRYFYNTLQGEGLPTPHLLMAAATVATLPPVGLFLLGQRYFVQGVVMSGLKA
jgi:ABC-type glycerol-3-phosphate transport system permease component